MCGVVARLGKGADVSEALDLLKHRGRRSKIVETMAGTVGHVRLPIVGLGEEHDQPILGRMGWTIGFVGELLDFRDTDPGVESDVEIVRDIWVEKGPKGFWGRDGFWGIAAVNVSTGCLHVLTDYLGQKPMYYRSDFPSAASEIDALMVFGPTTFDHVYLSAVIKWGYCPDVTRTPYNEIKHCLPGEHVMIYANGRTIRDIVDPLTPAPLGPTAFKEEIVQAVRRRTLSADVPVACLLSGGLDSSIVYTLASRFGNVKAYYAQETSGSTAGLDRALQVVAASERADTEIKIVPWEDVSIEAALEWMQEPIDLGSLLPQASLALAVEEDVCLTGDGADECFGGYGRSFRYDSQGSDLFQELPAWHLPRLDRIMMRNCVEIRTPFLARNVVQAAMGIPSYRKIDKSVLRQMFEGDLPHDILFAPKEPLRTKTVETDRERNSIDLVALFTQKFTNDHRYWNLYGDEGGEE